MSVVGDTAEWMGACGAPGLDLPGTLAVNTLSLRLANNDVRQGGAVLENEHGILFPSLLLLLANSG